MIELAEALGVQMVVTLGALLADVPHSRPVNVTAFATDDALVERLGLEPPTYEGPTGIVGVLHDACADAGMPSASLWAAVPHYVAVVPNPKGSLALLRRLECLIGDHGRRRRARGRRRRVRAPGLARGRDGPGRPGLRREARARPRTRRRARPDPSQLPSGDVLAREFQRFLRQRGNAARRPLTSLPRPPPGDRATPYFSAAGQAIR